MSSLVEQLFPFPVNAHAFNKDRSQVAICPNSNQVHIYEQSGSAWNLLHVLKEHDLLVTCIDWAPESNRLVTCGQDRNAYVWNMEEGTNQWKPTLVLLRINRAATFVRWSPREDKFAVASGARSVAICYFEEDNDWWMSKHLKKPIRATVLSVDWHPNNVLLAVGAADMRAYVLSAFIKSLDSKPAPGPWGEKLPFNTLCGEFIPPAGGWVHAVAFSPSGDALAFAGHDSSLTVIYPGSGSKSVVKSTGLPYVSISWLSEEHIVAVGHDCCPAYFVARGSEDWVFDRAINRKEAKKNAPSAGSSAFNMFRQMDSQGSSRSSSSSGDAKDLNTLHQNTITMVRPYKLSGPRVEEYSTSGLDGRLVIWAVGAGG
ncbi:WD40-repeat-containing domain protein [Piptocephalis cylindrospora]|uniref:Actin-related protein 2/3 complex subunit n=1 Tax=Piptocephalis cylindrospora TaxID=1907219 RepID=A0A4P9XXU9_9FUNG|nr:WD40-repeat-containing domain protein [Piptocephalis cylindrospora]|eukprot:RKP11218.1 WD40-repeat-containing domain protein [Piptocephalis cylindrospora]